jgi:hypothetical protein
MKPRRPIGRFTFAVKNAQSYTDEATGRGDSMTIEQAKSVSVWPYVGLYSLMMIGLTVVFMGILAMFPSFSDSFGKASGFAIAFGSTSFASYKFIKKNLRLFNREEYWKVTFFSSVASCLLSLSLLGLAIAGGAMPESNTIPALGWMFILLFVGLIAFGINAAGYSSGIGKSFLKAELARQTRINAETFK